MRFQKGNCGKRPKYNLYEIERLAKLGVPLAQLASRFGISYGYLRSVSCREKWQIARVYGYKHRFRKGAPPPTAAKHPLPDPASEPPPPAQSVNHPDIDWHRDFDGKWLEDIRANERSLRGRRTLSPYASGYSN